MVRLGVCMLAGVVVFVVCRKESSQGVGQILAHHDATDAIFERRGKRGNLREQPEIPGQVPEWACRATANGEGLPSFGPTPKIPGAANAHLRRPHPKAPPVSGKPSVHHRPRPSLTTASAMPVRSNVLCSCFAPCITTSLSIRSSGRCLEARLLLRRSLSRTKTAGSILFGPNPISMTGLKVQHILASLSSIDLRPRCLNKSSQKPTHLTQP